MDRWMDKRIDEWSIIIISIIIISIIIIIIASP